jgi:hypothetical protein
MKPLLAFALLLLPSCGVAARSTEAVPTPVWVLSRSHNRSAVDVYLLCGKHDAIWLGVVSEKGSDAFEVPAPHARCKRGLNFFLVVRDQGRGYWVGPFRPEPGASVDLVIEKYAGLSTARLRGTAQPSLVWWGR